MKNFLQPIGCSLYLQLKGCINAIIMRRDVFQAIADPTRRKIISVIAHETLTLNTVAASFDMSRQAVTKHVKILAECGLIELKTKGRECYCEPRLEKLNEIAGWIEQYRMFWSAHLDSMESYLEELKTTSVAKTKKHGAGKK